MTRTESETDRMLRSQVWESYRVRVSQRNLEVWRAAGLLPKNFQRSRGRARGKESAFGWNAVQIAAQLGRHARQGRNTHEVVLRAFTSDNISLTDMGPMQNPFTGEMQVFIPEIGVRSALRWHMQRPTLLDEIRNRIASSTSVDQVLTEIDGRLEYLTHEGARILARRSRSLEVSNPNTTEVADALRNLLADIALPEISPSEDRLRAWWLVLHAMGALRPEAERDGVAAAIINDELQDVLPTYDQRPLLLLGPEGRIAAVRKRTYRDICEIRTLMHFLARSIMVRRISLKIHAEIPFLRRSALLYACDPWVHQWMTILEHLIGLRGPENWSGMTASITMFCCRSTGLEDARRLAYSLETCFADSSIGEVERKLLAYLVANDKQ